MAKSLFSVSLASRLNLVSNMEIDLSDHRSLIIVKTSEHFRFHSMISKIEKSCLVMSKGALTRAVTSIVIPESNIPCRSIHDCDILVDFTR